MKKTAKGTQISLASKRRKV